MQRKGNALTLLVGMQVSATTLENGVEIPEKNRALWDISIANIFSFSVGCLFHFVDGLLCKDGVVPAVNFGFCLPCLWRPLSRKTFLQPMSKKLLPWLSFRDLMVLHLTFWVLIDFEFIFCVWCEKVVHFHSLAVAVQFSSTTDQRDCLSPIVHSCLLCHRLMDHQCVLLLISALPLICTHIFVIILYSFRYYSFAIDPKTWDCGTSIFLLPQDCFGCFRVFCTSITNFSIICPSAVKNAVGALIGIELNLYMFLDSMNILTNSSNQNTNSSNP